MTVSATLLGTLLHGVAASRPAANAVAGGTVYSATDTGAISQSDGSSWTTWATISAGIADQGAFTFLDGTVASAPATPAAGKLRLYAKTGKVLAVKDDAGVETVFGASGGGFLQSAIATRTAGDLTRTGSTAYVDMTGMTVTLTTGAHRCLVIFQGNGNVTGAAAQAVDVAVDGTRQGQAYGQAIIQGTGMSGSLGFTFLTDVLTAASHTIKVQWMIDVSASTGNMWASTAISGLKLTVLETSMTT
jgi:hypothetical protein